MYSFQLDVAGFLGLGSQGGLRYYHLGDLDLEERLLWRWQAAGAVGIQERPRCGADPASLLHEGAKTELISRPWWATAAAISVLAATAVALVAACGSGIATGTALTNDASQQMGLVTIRTNTEIGVVGTLLHNDSQAPITIDAIKLAGKGLGTVVRPVETQIADGGPDSSVPQSVYVENPPVILTTGGCNVEALRPVAGYRLKPGGYVAVWTVVLGLRPGRFNLDRHLITYTQDGTRYQESTMQGFHGAVARGAPLLTTAAENSDGCWHHSHLLKGIPW